VSTRRQAAQIAFATICAVACLGLRPFAAPQDPTTAAIDAILADPLLSRALVAVRVESLATHRVIYARNSASLVMPASVMKLITAVVAAERLGWDYRFTTRIDAVGPIAGGTLTGDLVVTCDGDPAISSQDLRPSSLFYEWAEALRAAGVRRIDGRVIVDDHAFDNETLGGGWAWDYLAAGYAAPSSAASYNENVAILRISPGPAVGAPATIQVGPPGHGLEAVNAVVTIDAATPASIAIARFAGQPRVTIRGTIPAGSATLVRATSVDNPTTYLAEALRLALTDAGISVTGGAWDLDTTAMPVATGPRRSIAEHRSPPLSALVGYALKVSQNFYGDMLLKAIGRAASGTGSADAGQRAVRETLTNWQLPVESLVMVDGSGLSRYSYVSADLLVGVLAHAWNDERLRGPFVAALPVGGHDGTLENRMRGTALDLHIQAKTGTISNVRSLAGYATTTSGEKLAFSVIVNNFTAPNAQIDGLVERMLQVVVQGR
jgi:D-alanyl-D-alanine carboxypeptidase/D-alanyl-D-alanine-endopeptidase (penicillin-binding protein 4)